MTKKLLVVSFLMVAFSCKQSVTEDHEEKKFVLSEKMFATTKTEKAQFRPLRTEMSFYGKVTPDNNKMIEIFPIVGGNVTKVFVELGDYVEKGQLLASIRSTEVAGFEKELEDAKNDLIVAKNNVKVAQELFEGRLSAERDVLEAKSHLEKAQSQLHRIQETYSIYNIKGGAIFEIRSPLAGFIIQKKINEGMLLRNDKTDNVFDIAQIDQIWIIANINESDINQVKLGIDAAVTTLSYPNRVFNGKVDKIFNIIDPETKAMKVRIKLENEDYLLKPDMRATIKLSYEEKEKMMLSVPSQAIIFDRSKHFVIVFNSDKKLETRQVEIIRQVGDITYLKGVSEGDRVVTHNQLLIYDALND